MWKLNDVTAVEYRGGHVYRIRFDDGLEGDMDFSAYIGRGPVFRPFADLSFFQRARVEGGTITWPNGADIAPETLYEMIENCDRKTRVAARRKGGGRTRRPLKKDTPLRVRDRGR
jgi:hypothetical protein